MSRLDTSYISHVMLAVLTLGSMNQALAGQARELDEVSVFELDPFEDDLRQEWLDRGPAVNTIVEGTPVTAGKYPFMVRLTITDPSGSSYLCGGSLVAKGYVMTAAHCVVGTSRSGVSAPGDVTTYIGGTNLTTAVGEVRSVAEVIVHPSYDVGPATNVNDVALLRLSSASTKTPIDLASPYRPGDRELWRPADMVTTMGWGRTCESCSTSPNLLEVTVPVVSDSSMATSYGSDFDPRVHVGAGFATGGYDSCQGDSGGPLIAPSANGYQQLGVVSWGEGCARAGLPGVYTRVGGMVVWRWVQSVIHTTPAVGDFNKDLRDDILSFTYGATTSGPVSVALSNGSSFGTASTWMSGWTYRGEIPAVGDFNADGYDDIFVFTTTQAWVQLNRGGADFYGTRYISTAGTVDENDIPLVGDVTGDGRADVVLFAGDTSGDVYVIPATSTGFGAKKLWHSYFAPEGETPSLGDVNGDGRQDIITFTQRDGDSDVWVALSSGSGFGTSYKAHDYFGLVTEVPMCGNFNGTDSDGKKRADIITFTRNSLKDVWVAQATSAGSFGTSGVWNGTFADGDDTPLVGDFNKDGRDDIVRFTQDSAADVYVSLSTGSTFGAATLWHGTFAP